MEQNNDWIKNLKQGDKVFVEVGHFSTYTVRPGIVERFTKTLIVLKDGRKFRFDGTEVGSCYPSRLRQHNEETMNDYWIQEHRKDLQRAIEHLSYINSRIHHIHLTREQIERIAPILIGIGTELEA